VVQGDRYAVMGNPVEHSLSPQIHALFAEQTQENVCYERLLAESDQFEARCQRFFKDGGRGLNITLPFKRAAKAWVTHCSDRAELAGSVNTIVLEAAGRYFGDNTDGVGLIRDMQNNLGWSLSGKKVLILGAGGAVCGVLGPMLAENTRQVIIANRTHDKALRLAQRFSQQGSVAAAHYGDLSGQLFDVVIQGTAVELMGGTLSLPAGILSEGAVCYDLMYGKKPSSFLRWAAANGARQSANGIGMLVEQAAESFWLWRGVRPETGPVIARFS